MKVAATREGLVFSGDLESGHVAYVDGAAALAGGELEAFVVDASGTLDDPRVALGALVGSIQDVLGEADGATEVTAEGAVATVLRSTRTPPVDGKPVVVVDLTGDPSVLRAATERLVDLGTLVLARDPTSQFDLDLYPNVHVRGLRIVGAPAPSDWAPVDVPSEVGGPVNATLGAPVAPGAPWYRVTGQA